MADADACREAAGGVDPVSSDDLLPLLIATLIQVSRHRQHDEVSSQLRSRTCCGFYRVCRFISMIDKARRCHQLFSVSS